MVLSIEKEKMKKYSFEVEFSTHRVFMKRMQMEKHNKQLSTAISTGGGGLAFEIHVQAAFLALMLTGGFAPCLACWPIQKIKLQGKYAGYDTDDMIVFIQQPGGVYEQKLLIQIKQTITITEGDKIFGEVIQAAWSDFNNPKIFKRGIDQIALITGPLSITDIYDVRTILEWSRSCEDANEFFQKVELARFSSQRKRSKLSVFRVQLKRANGGKEISDEDLFQFLKHFHLLGYDLDIKAGVTLSLLQSLIGQYSQENAQFLWAQFVEEILSTNKNAGTITRNTLPDDLLNVFKKRALETIPEELVKTLSPTIGDDWNHFQYSSELAIVNLIGSWNEKSEADIAIVSQLAGKDFSSWISHVRDILQSPDSPITLKNGIWTVSRRQEAWHILGPRLFDIHLDHFKQCAIAVLKERDPQFELAPEERFTAALYDKVLKHSQQLRNGISESLALLGNSSSDLTNCSLGKAETIAAVTLRDILSKADYMLWGSLNNVLPFFAEASPDIFLSAVEAALQQSPCPFDDLFSQEGNGISGGNYLTGLLWALETLAWDDRFLVRTTVILGDLATHDPGGNWANRPSNSLTSIFLPWFPQTTAPLEKRRVAIKVLQKEFSQVAWQLLLNLMPGQHQTTGGSRKPVWRKAIPGNWKDGVTTEDYWSQVSVYAEVLLEMARQNIQRLEELTHHLDELPSTTFEKFLEQISAKDIIDKPENERLNLWVGLLEFIEKHKRFPDAKWAIGAEKIAQIEEVSKTLAPKNPLNLYRRLFCDRDHDLYTGHGDWLVQQMRLDKDRQGAIQEIFDFDGIQGVINFVDTVEAPRKVGYSLGCIDKVEVDHFILPNFLIGENTKLEQFAAGFIWGRYHQKGWEWVDTVFVREWSEAQIGRFLAFLPFCSDTWARSQAFLADHDGEYWNIVNVNPYQADGSLSVAIDKLIEFGRPNAALNCLHKTVLDKQPLDYKQAVRALLATLSSTETLNRIDVHEVAEVIKALQNAPEINPDDLLHIEWAYLPMLDGHHGTLPVFLENQLATDANFFCEVVRAVYRSKKEQNPRKEVGQQEKAMATNAYYLLSEWRTPPGIMPNDQFVEDHFKQWLEAVKTISEESGHLEVALHHVGEVLIHCPPDPSGLWINCAVADALNAKDAEDMREGFHLGIFNSRGVHWIDPTGKPELELASEYKRKAEEVENAGYQRFAITLRNLAEVYVREAKRIIDEHQSEEIDER